ncbi:MAG: polysaccharide deacetylase family protein [Proteobacteria bacterium]|nr:polysaccharide deacetylase family protein [Pseudomonadota bacterium]MBU1708534.1 polysaccharide deacetylase family protein [Pseudomonadota bacterium]
MTESNSSDQHSGGTVLIYHRFGESEYPTTNVSVDRFREQMSFLKENGYKVISLETLASTLAAGKKIPDKSVVITIDDGYLSTYTQAWPILKSFGYPFTVFIYVKAVDRKYRNFITWDQIREMKRAGVDFQEHSYSHNRMADRPSEMNDRQYRNWIRDDLVRSAKIMENELGEKPRYFAIPYGEYNSFVIDEAKKVGYQAIMSQDPGSVSKNTDVFLIPREPILGKDWSGIDHFSKILNRVDLPVADIYPDIVPRQSQSPEKFSARILYPEKYMPGTYGVYVSELGWQQGELQGNVLSVPNHSPLQRRLNRVIVSAREKDTGRMAIRTWLLIQDRPKDIPQD